MYSFSCTIFHHLTAVQARFSSLIPFWLMIWPNFTNSNWVNLHTFIGYASTGITLVLIVQFSICYYFHSFLDLFSDSIINFFSFYPVSMFYSKKPADFFLVWVHSLHPFLEHLKSFAFHHLSSFENNLKLTWLLRNMFQCHDLLAQWSHSHLSRSYDSPVYLQIIYKQAMCTFDISVSWLTHSISIRFL